MRAPCGGQEAAPPGPSSSRVSRMPKKSFRNALVEKQEANFHRSQVGIPLILAMLLPFIKVLLFKKSQFIPGSMSRTTLVSF